MVSFSLYIFFWVIPRRLNFIYRRFGTNCLSHLHRQVGVENTYLPMKMKMEQTECSETSSYKIQTPGNYPEEKHTAYRTRRKFAIKNFSFFIIY